jgi:hypothetical protein
MKFNYLVRHNGVDYPAGTDVPVEGEPKVEPKVEPKAEPKQKTESKKPFKK